MSIVDKFKTACQKTLLILQFNEMPWRRGYSCPLTQSFLQLLNYFFSLIGSEILIDFNGFIQFRESPFGEPTLPEMRGIDFHFLNIGPDSSLHDPAKSIGVFIPKNGQNCLQGIDCMSIQKFKIVKTIDSIKIICLRNIWRLAFFITFINIDQAFQDENQPLRIDLCQPILNFVLATFH